MALTRPPGPPASEAALPSLCESHLHCLSATSMSATSMCRRLALNLADCEPLSLRRTGVIRYTGAFLESTMALKYLVAHRLERPDPQHPANIKTAKDPWQINGQLDELFREMKICVIKRAGKAYGQFSSDHGTYPMAAWLKEFSEEKITFESFGLKIAQQLKHALDQIEVPLDAFLVQSYETLEQGDLLHLFIVQHEQGLYIDGDMQVSTSVRLSTNDIKLAAKVNISDWQCDDVHRNANAVSVLLWRGEKELSDAFLSTIGFADKLDLKADTEAFLNAVDEYTKSLPTELAEHTRAEVVDYCLELESAGEPIVFDRLSNKIDEDLANQNIEIPTPPPFKRFVAENTAITKPTLIADKTQMRNYARISGRNALLSMSFASRCLGESVVYDTESDSLTFTNLPSSLKERLKKHLSAKSRTPSVE